MATILPAFNRTSNALAFASKFGIDSTENLYLTLGLQTEWGTPSDVSSDNNQPASAIAATGTASTPPSPIAELGVLSQVASTMIAAKKIAVTDIAPVMSKTSNVWTSGTTYNQIATNVADPYSTSNYYVINSESRVYICKTKGGGTSTVMPSGTGVAGTGADIGRRVVAAGADGYAWYYLFDINPTLSACNTNDWIPVPYSSLIRTTGGYNEDLNSAYLLGCRKVMITGKFDASISFGQSVADEFRQVCLVHNPLLLGGSYATASQYYNATTCLSSQWQTANPICPLNILYVDFRKAITRAPGQTEEFRIVLQF